MFHNGYLGDETLTREYKEFTFNHIGLEFNQTVAEDLIKSSKWIFNELIDKNIQKYLRIYLPKYTAGFMDVLSETSSGELYIGVNDAGVIQGIPYQGCINIEMIRNEIETVIKEYIICDASKRDLIFDNINVELIPLEYYESNLPVTHESLVRYYEQKKGHILKEQMFANEFTKWYQTFTMYTQKKLVDLFNSEPTRTEIYNYIQNKKPDSVVLKMINDGYQLEIRNHDEITVLKEDINNPYYWVCEWKDLRIDNLKLEKPTPKHRFDMPNLFHPINILTKLNCMIPNWMQNNDNMNLYLIKITFKKPQDINEIYYLDTFNKINRCYRTLFEDNPCCSPI